MAKKEVVKENSKAKSDYNINTHNRLNRQSEVRESVKVKTQNKEVNSPGEIIDKTIKPLLAKHNIKFIDKRSKGGAFWIIGGMEIKDLIVTFNKYGLKLVFAKNGGRSTGHKPAWYTK